MSPVDQQTVLPVALHESADPCWTLEDPEFDAILTEQAEEAAQIKYRGSTNGNKKRSSRHEDPGAWKMGLTPEDIDKVIKAKKNELRCELFSKGDLLGHFSQLTIMNELHVWILDKGSAGSAAHGDSAVSTVSSDGGLPGARNPSASGSNTSMGTEEADEILEAGSGDRAHPESYVYSITN